MHSILIPEPVRHTLFSEEGNNTLSTSTNLLSVEIYSKKGKSKQSKGAFKLFRRKNIAKNTPEISEDQKEGM